MLSPLTLLRRGVQVDDEVRVVDRSKFAARCRTMKTPSRSASNVLRPAALVARIAVALPVAFTAGGAVPWRGGDRSIAMERILGR
jgi:hypothetical protein